MLIRVRGLCVGSGGVNIKIWHTGMSYLSEVGEPRFNPAIRALVLEYMYVSACDSMLAHFTFESMQN